MTVSTYTAATKRYRESEKGKAYYKAYRASEREKVRIAKRNGEARTTPLGWKKEKLRQLKCRAKRSDLDFDLTLEDLDIPQICPVFGIPLKLEQQYGNKHALKNPDVLSVDRTDNTKGYVKGNIRIMSNRANLLKRDGTLEEFEQIVTYLRRLKSL